MLNIEITQGLPETHAPCVIVGVFEDGKLTNAAQHYDQLSGGLIQKTIEDGDLKGKVGETLTLFVPNGSPSRRLLIVGCGKENELDNLKYQKLLGATYKRLSSLAAKEAQCHLLEVPVKNADDMWKLRQAIQHGQDYSYQFDEFKSKQNPKPNLDTLHLVLHDSMQSTTSQSTLNECVAMAHGAALTRDLANRPANACTPTDLANEAKALAKSHKNIKVSVYEEKDMAKLGMGAFLAVAAGSEEPAKMIVMEYNGASDKDPIALVGKGITFDSGGISLKPGASMDEMKYDMCGAATVLGTLKAVAELELPLKVVGVIAASENMPDGRATRPGDIVKTMSGQTVEILNTDAEGRLVLCDALTFVGKYNPRAVIDIATLTGAMVVALGAHPTGYFATDEKLATDLQQAATETNDRIWRMPLWDDYQEELDSNFADMANIGGRWGGAITAACYLARFTKDYKWAHLDIAGSAWKSGKAKGATGRPVPLLTQYLINVAKQDA